MTERLDLTSDPDSDGPKRPAARVTRPFLGVQFACCGIYSRIYQNKTGTQYVGNCPKCAKQVRFTIGSGGSDNRFFTAY